MHLFGLETNQYDIIHFDGQVLLAIDIVVEVVAIVNKTALIEVCQIQTRSIYLLATYSFPLEIFELDLLEK